MSGLRLYNTRGLTPVPCPRCGKPNRSWFPDGSPAYSCSHAPATRSPYYEDEAVTLYHGDYLEIAAELPPADLLILDPPFDLWPEVSRVWAQPVTALAFLTWQYRQDVTELLGAVRTELIWAFADGRWTSHNLPRVTHETILVFGKTGSAYVGRETDGVPRAKGESSIGRDRLGPRTYTPHERKALNSVLTFPRNVSADLGVWSKPLPLMSQLIEWCATGPLIIDPFAGSGTSLVAAKALGKKVIGVELEERNCEIAANRCRQETLGLTS